MSDDIVVIDNGQTYETQETSIVAKEEADRAERWAKFAEEQANLASGQAIEAAEASDAAAQAATVTVENSDYVKGLLDNDGFRAVAADMIAEPSSIKTALENANNVAAEIEQAVESATIASQQAEDAQHWAEDSRVWAVGSDTEVNQLAPNQGKHSSKTYADLAGNEADRAQQEADRAKQYGNDRINQTHITNCITEIPQDIKLELADGVLTLKAGSKVYVPNGKNADGSNKFDEVVIKSDLIKSDAINATCFICTINGIELANFDINKSFSGANAPTGFSGVGIWYDTTNNKIKLTTDGGASWRERLDTLPIAIAQGSGGIYVSIDRVFNGFGRIGKRNYILPNIKLLISKGYNKDGSHKNQEYIVNNVLISNNDLSANSIMFFRNHYTNGYQIYNISKNNYLGELSSTPAVSATFQWYYNTTERLWYMHEAHETSWKQMDYANLGTNTANETSFKEVFRAVDYNEIDYVVKSYQNGTNWYRLYKSGWIEQGGAFVLDQLSYTFLKPFKDTNISMSWFQSGASSGSVVRFAFVQGQGATRTGFAIQQANNPKCFPATWEAKGYAE